ncbi:MULTISPECIES: substrate-binding domain-containing protein [Streptacidiphilus]|uniref:Sugar ABC transporter substrate-binding protein n=2 Tax=Streptacidiphilus TaxID=228398 RepID=A0ABV6UIZ1_9ACTN|nr:substrate-binding domain-containing protein [Streptacidiphilus jeojiense]
MRPYGKRRLMSCAAFVAASAVLAGCGSSGSQGAGGGASGSGSSGSGAGTGSASAGSDPVAAGLAMAEQQVAKLSATTATYPVPTASVSGTAKFKGRTVYYIPLVQQIPGFVVTAATMKTALAKAGLSLQVCNGQGQPSAVAACVQQAVGANAAGIITDAIEYGMAKNALDAAKAKGVPIVVADQIPPTGTANDNALTYVPGAVDQPSQIAWWLIADSKGKGNEIIAAEADSTSSMTYVTDSEPIYAKYCPDCKITVKTITATTDALLASATSSNVLSNPGATYYYTEFEDSLQDTVQGLQQSGRASSMSLSVAGGSVNGLGLLKGDSVVKAVVAVDQPYAGWALTDEILRMMTKSGPVTETFPTRLFTKQNIGSVQVTPAAQASGEWFGDSSFEAAFAKLWGQG